MCTFHGENAEKCAINVKDRTAQMTSRYVVSKKERKMKTTKYIIMNMNIPVETPTSYEAKENCSSGIPRNKKNIHLH